MTQIFFDLDGTVIDYSKRNYAVYKNLIETFGGKPLRFASYWRLKRNKTDMQTISKESALPQHLYGTYVSAFILHIELPESLAKDRCFAYTKRSLKKLQRNNFKLYLVTVRRTKKTTLDELKRLDLVKFFSGIGIGRRTRDSVKAKVEQIKRFLAPGSPAYVVGDTEDDILSAKALKISSIAVVSGIRNKEKLMMYKPDYIVDHIGHIAETIAS